LEELCGSAPGSSFLPASLSGWFLHIRLRYLAIGTPIYLHRHFSPVLTYQRSYLENNLMNIFAKSVLQDSSFQQIMVGGSNFGELCGAMTVFFTVNHIPTWVPLLFLLSFLTITTRPIPFLRLDALFMLIIWYLPFYTPPPHRSIEAWKMAATFIPVSLGWAAGDVSLAAYIQASLARGIDDNTAGISTLGAVMSFLYVTYVRPAVLLPLLSYLLPRLLDYHLCNSLPGPWELRGFASTVREPDTMGVLYWSN
jgi:hypothetical protein